MNPNRGTQPSLFRPRLREWAWLVVLWMVLFILSFIIGQKGIPVEDGGEFLTVARLGGIAHPPGMPLLAQLARCSWIAFGSSGLRILFAIMAALSLTFLGAKKTLATALLAAGLLLLPAVRERLLMWDAYSLMFLIFAVTLQRRPGADLEGGYLAGLAIASHPQGILLLLLLDWKRLDIPRIAGGLLLGLSIFLALPLMSAAGAVMDWGSPGSLSTFIRQVSAGGYREAFASSMGGEAFTESIAIHGKLLIGMLWPALLLPAGLGIWSLFKSDRFMIYILMGILVLDALFIGLINPMAAGTTQTGTLSLLALLFISFKGVTMAAGFRTAAGIGLGLLVLIAGMTSEDPLVDQTKEVDQFFRPGPLEAVYFIQSNDLLYGGWVLKFVEDRRPDVVLLSTDNFSLWFERMAITFNPGLDLSPGVSDVGDFSIPRNVLASRLMDRTVEDNPGRPFLTDFR